MKYTVFIDGEFLVRDEHLIEALTPGIFEGRGVFETIRIEEGHVCLFERHLKRFRQGLKVLKIRCPRSAREIQTIAHKVLTFNQFKNARLRIMAYQKNGVFELAVMVLPRTVFSEQDYFHGYHVTTVRCAGRPVKYACVKSLDYGRYYELYQQARDKGFNEALLVNPQGFVYEGSRSNIFFFRKGILYTPSLTLGCLNGITRQLIIECAREMKIPVKTVKPKVSDLLSADEVFLTNAIIGVMPITKLDGKVIQSGRVGDGTYQIRSCYLKKFINSKPALNLMAVSI
jgi:branched-subunit amino acid aminotransferase/4-amino-4-deoxychorismate lyase